MDLTPVLESLIFEDVVVWDNSREAKDEMTFGRARAAFRTRYPIIYSQDDDIIHSAANQRAIVNAYEPGVLTGCMWPEWSQGAKDQGIPNGYDDLVFPGSGSVYDRETVRTAVDLYLEQFPADDFFALWCDTIVGIMAPTKQLDIRFEELPEATADYRMANLPDGIAQKSEAIRRARWVRDEASVAA